MKNINQIIYGLNKLQVKIKLQVELSTHQIEETNTEKSLPKHSAVKCLKKKKENFKSSKIVQHIQGKLNLLATNLTKIRGQKALG